MSDAKVKFAFEPVLKAWLVGRLAELILEATQDGRSRESTIDLDAITQSACEQYQEMQEEPIDDWSIRGVMKEAVAQALLIVAQKVEPGRQPFAQMVASLKMAAEFARAQEHVPVRRPG